MNKITLPLDVTADDNNNNNSTMEEPQMTSEIISVPGVSSSFLIPNEES